jgi:hypothetical protein
MLTAEDRLFNHDSTWTILNFAKRCEDASHSKALRAKCFTTAVSFREAFGVRTRRRVALIGDR